MYKEGEPDYKVPPGATISGDAWIDSDLAERLGGLTGIPTRMWHRLEQDWRT